MFEEPVARPLLLIAKKYVGVFHKNVEDTGLDRFHYILLLIKEQKRPVTQKDLARILQVDKSYITNVVDHLNKKGYLRREINEQDRRQQFLKLTDKAEQEIPIIAEAIRALNRVALQHIPAEKLVVYSEVLHQIKENLRQLPGDELIIHYSRVNE